MLTSQARAFESLAEEIEDALTLHVDGEPTEANGVALMAFWGLEGRMTMPYTEHYRAYLKSPELKREFARQLAAQIWGVMSDED